MELLTGAGEAGRLVGTVLVEALVLYVGYGALLRVAGPRIAAAVRGE